MHFFRGKSAMLRFLIVLTVLGVLNATRTTHFWEEVLKNPPNGVTKCCDGYYDLMLDYCHHSEQVEPTVALISSNETDDNRSYNLPQCPEGYIVQVRTDVPSEEEQLGGFCVAQIESEEDDPQYVGRFCVADPCKQSNCIRKCCPEGMAIIGRTCQSFAEEFAPVVRKKNGAVENITDITILAGVGAPICKEGINLLMPSNNSYDEFLVLPSGSIHIPSYSQDLGVEYCTDILLGDNTKDTVALICFPEFNEEDVAVYPYLMSVSAGFLLVTFVVYASISQLRNLFGVIVMSYSISLAVMFICLATIKLATQSVSDSTCIVLAVICHFSFISTFTWLNVMSFNTWCTISMTAMPLNGSSKRRCLLYSVYAWGLPLLIVIIGRVMDSLETGIRPKFGTLKCWFADDLSVAMYLYVPISVLILMNVVLFVRITIKLCLASSSSAFININIKRKMLVVFSLVVLSGVTWIMEIVSFAARGHFTTWIISDVLNISTGIFVFIIFVCNKHVWMLIRRRRDNAASPELDITFQNPTIVYSK